MTPFLIIIGDSAQHWGGGGEGDPSQRHIKLQPCHYSSKTLMAYNCSPYMYFKTLHCKMPIRGALAFGRVLDSQKGPWYLEWPSMIRGTLLFRGPPIFRGPRYSEGLRFVRAPIVREAPAAQRVPNIQRNPDSWEGPWWWLLFLLGSLIVREALFFRESRWP